MKKGRKKGEEEKDRWSQRGITPPSRDGPKIVLLKKMIREIATKLRPKKIRF